MNPEGTNESGKQEGRKGNSRSQTNGEAALFLISCFPDSSLLASGTLSAGDDWFFLQVLGSLLLCFILGLLIGCWLGTRYGTARQQARNSERVPTLFQTPIDKRDKYYQ